MRSGVHRVFSRTSFGCLCALAGISLSAKAQTTAPNEWTWIGGSQTISTPAGTPGVYGQLGTSAAGNYPGARDSAANWTDTSGNFWLFGGEGPDANGVYSQLNDLWEFKPSTQQWTWIGGSSTVPASCAGSTTVACGQPGVYGNLGSAAAANVPGGRSEVSYWTDNSGNFWLFGGGGFDKDQTLGALNDLWEFSPVTKEWTWMGGSSTIGSAGGQIGVYGTLGAAASANIPGSRGSATSWTDKNGLLWLYGGGGFDSQGNVGQLDDLWRYDPSTSEWTWMSGSSTSPSACASPTPDNGLCGWPPIYGTIGVPAAGIGPGSRVGALGWVASDGSLWLFGGLGNDVFDANDFSEVDEYDLWRFDPTAQQWAWMSGGSTSTCGASTSEESWCGQVGIYGTEGTPAVGNIPPSRDTAMTWTDAAGNFWLFAGEQLATTTGVAGIGLCDDVWVYEPSANEWAWMGGTADNDPYSCSAFAGKYGVLGAPAAADLPPGRFGAANWIGATGNSWLFGGYGDSNIGPVDLSDFWIYQPVAPAPAPSFALVASPNPINIPAYVPGSSTITTATATVQVVTGGGFDGPVTLAATPFACNAGTCITGSFSPSTVTGVGSSTLTFSVNGSETGFGVPYTVTITGTSGGASQSTQVIVCVTSVQQLEAPTFSVPGGVYSTPQTVSLVNDANVNFVYFTTDGTTPTLSSAVYVNPIPITSTTTLKAVAINQAFLQSPLTTVTYTIVPAAATPAFSPAGGTYLSAQSVTITDSTTGATIYYTTDGSTPTTSSTAYSSPITVSSDETLQAIATATGYASSAIASAVYIIGPPSFTITGTAVTVTPGATTANTSTITLTPSNGFNGAISLSCAITPTAASDPAACSIPSSATITGSVAQTVTLTVTTTAATTAHNRVLKFFGPPAGGAALACILFFGIPARRRRGWSILGMLLLLFAIGGIALGCGGGGGGGGNSGTTPGTYSITVTGTAGTLTETGTVSLTVE